MAEKGAPETSFARVVVASFAGRPHFFAGFVEAQREPRGRRCGEWILLGDDADSFSNAAVRNFGVRLSLQCACGHLRRVDYESRHVAGDPLLAIPPWRVVDGRRAGAGEIDGNHAVHAGECAFAVDAWMHHNRSRHCSCELCRRIVFVAYVCRALVAQSCAPTQQGGCEAVTASVENDSAMVLCRFVRERNALLCAADFGPMFMDLYLHLGQTGIVLADGADEKLKLLLAALTLHAASRPHAETCAWTMHFDDERVNLFAVAENPTGHVTGQVFSENVRSTGGNVLHAETASANLERRRSSVDFSGDDVFRASETYYTQSEQRLARYFDLGGDSFALLVAQPDCDLAWLENVAVEEVRGLFADDSRPPLETRCYSFACGCTPERIAGAIRPALQGEIDEVFGAERHICVTCPRCGVRHEIPRELFDAGEKSG